MSQQPHGFSPFKRGQTSRLSDLRRLEELGRRAERGVADGADSFSSEIGRATRVPHEEGIWAQITAQPTPGTLTYSFQEMQDGASNVGTSQQLNLIVKPGGVVADATGAAGYPAFEANGNLKAPIGAIVWARFNGAGPSWSFLYNENAPLSLPTIQNVTVTSSSVVTLDPAADWLVVTSVGGVLAGLIGGTADRPLLIQNVGPDPLPVLNVGLASQTGKNVVLKPGDFVYARYNGGWALALPDYRVLTDSLDTSPDYLFNKVEAGVGIAIDVDGPPGNARKTRFAATGQGVMIVVNVVNITTVVVLNNTLVFNQFNNTLYLFVGGVWVVVTAYPLTVVNYDGTQACFPCTVLGADNDLGAAAFGRIVARKTSDGVSLLDWQGHRVYVLGTGYIGPRPDLQFIAGANITSIVVADDPGLNTIDVTINAAGGATAGVVGGFPQWIKIVVNFNDSWVNVAALTATQAILTLPAAGVLHAIKMWVPTAWTGLAMGNGPVPYYGYSGGAGMAAATDNYYGTTNNAGMQTPAALPGFSTTLMPDCENQGATWNVTLKLVSNGGNLSTLTAGVLDVWLLVSLPPA